MSRRPARCTEADLKRAIKAAQAVGKDWAVEVLPDGTIRLMPFQGQGVNKQVSSPEGDIVL